MKRDVVIEIECGETVCNTAPGRYCKFALFLNGTAANVWCSLHAQPIKTEGAELLRCSLCMKGESAR
jgi:hypothetical protein